jgi:hypothetical protein
MTGTIPNTSMVDSSGLVSRSVGRENCCWPSPAQSFLFWVPSGPMTKFLFITGHVFWNGASSSTRGGVWLLLLTARTPLFSVGSGKLLLAFGSTVLVLGPVRSHDHNFVFSKILHVFKWGLLFDEKSDLTTNLCLMVVDFGLVSQINCCWASPAQSFFILGPVGPMTIFFVSRLWL